ncbi:hypothetical protein OS125_04490 [Corynebacterium sp. P7003]|uniref:ATP-binding protein n=1 Tax=Corynebacterium pygosceleis TaxID=2800406 RepID=A0ABT3WQH6_9CORY|nr:hypothetical protein [Corynebacterium pygosceleis]MCX7444505.1 hypothetical protein [Corynebacterium pygosceleis]
MRIFHHNQVFDPSGGFHASSAKRTMTGQSMDTWEMFTRESLQNSWDARDRVSTEDGVTFAVDYDVIEGTDLEVLRSVILGNDFTGVPALKSQVQEETVPLLTVSDTGTVGLRGPSNATSATTGHTEFTSFVRNIGRSDQKELAGGTYGFGKAVFFIASRVDTVMVYTRTSDENDQPVHRFISMALTDGYQDGSVNHTGRHWWGIESRATTGTGSVTYAEPFTGELADRCAKAMGMDRYFSEERPTGTAISVIAPDLAAPETGLRNIARSLTRWAWPHMVTTEPDLDPIEFHVNLRGSAIDIPAPQDDPALKSFMQTYARALSMQPSESEEWRESLVYRTTRVFTGRPRKKELGRLSVKTLVAPVDEKDTVVGKTIESEVALIRNPRMIVEYWKGPPDVTGEPYCGVFLADEAADRVFARSEPAAHHEWNHESIQNEKGLLEEFWGSDSRNNPVKIFFEHMRLLLKRSVRKNIGQGEDRHFAAATDIARGLGDYLANSVGGVDTRVTKPRRSSGGRGGGRKSRTVGPTTDVRLVDLRRSAGDQITAVFDVTVDAAETVYPIRLDAKPLIRTDGSDVKLEDAADAGVEFPVFESWEVTSRDSGDVPFTGSSLVLNEPAIQIRASVSQPADCAITLYVDITELAPGTGETQQ